MTTKLDRLRDLLREMDTALLAYSGGVDSTFLLRVANEVLGDRLVALTVRSPTAADDEFADAQRMARALDVEHVLVDSNELLIPGYAENPTNRCYFCKGNLFTICKAEADRRGIAVVLDGANVDDLGDYRPGLQAASEHLVRHPLVEAELRKDEIRAFSHEMGLPTWDKPASPCLSSRFPYGTKITEERLRQIGDAEKLLHDSGFRTCRVRFHDQVARIEVPVADLPRLLEEAVRSRIIQGIKDLGFLYVTVDLQGLRSGSLNEALSRGSRPSGPTTDLPLS